MSSHFSRLKQFFKVLAITAAWSTGFSVLTTAQVVNQIGPDPLTKEGIQEISQIVPLAEFNQPESDQPVKTVQTIIPSVALWEKSQRHRKLTS